MGNTNKLNWIENVARRVFAKAVLERLHIEKWRLVWSRPYVVFFHYSHTIFAQKTHIFAIYIREHTLCFPPVLNSCFQITPFVSPFFGERDSWKLTEVVSNTDCEARIRGPAIDVPTHGQYIVGFVVLWWCVRYTGGPALIVNRLYHAGQR